MKRGHIIMQVGSGGIFSRNVENDFLLSKISEMFILFCKIEN